MSEISLRNSLGEGWFGEDEADSDQYRAFMDILLSEAEGNKGKGDAFENLCLYAIKKSPFFRNLGFKEAWLWKDFPYKDPGSDQVDLGIDIVALNENGDYYACQCKCYEESRHVSREDISTFLLRAMEGFSKDGENVPFAKERILFATSGISANVDLEKNHLIIIDGPKFLKLGIDYSSLDPNDILGTLKIRDEGGKRLRDHQKEAVKDVLEKFHAHDRGKLVMACGTGKTFTSLAIAEQWIQENRKGENAFVLYLVPSIALLSQTLISWIGDRRSDRKAVFLAVCSDSSAAKKGRKGGVSKDTLRQARVELPIAPTTDSEKLVEQWKASFPEGTSGKDLYLFSTYQSIEVIEEFQKKTGLVFDLLIADEAHRTISAWGASESTPTFGHCLDDTLVPARKRLFMTATPKIYSEKAKKEARENNYAIYSMDDEAVYGPTFHELTFGRAIDLGLLSDYRVIVMRLRQGEGRSLGLSQLDLDDRAKVYGSLMALSKVNSLDSDDFSEDPGKMKRAVAFCRLIKYAEGYQKAFESLRDQERSLGIGGLKAKGFVIPYARMVSGGDSASERNRDIQWLRDGKEEREGVCRILTNAECLSEGVDVPALDAVLFLERKTSEVDIIQAVGRVMRKAEGKKYGYIVIPVVVPADESSGSVLSDSEDYKTVWKVVKALRSHDKRLDAELGSFIETNRLPERIRAFDVPLSEEGCPDGFTDTLKEEISESIGRKDADSFEKELGIQLVKKCGDRLYWEDWSKNVGKVTKQVAEAIENEVREYAPSRPAFLRFLKEFRSLVRSSISEEEAVDMLAQHIVVLPVLQALFQDNSELVDRNPITRAMRKVEQSIKGTDKLTEELRGFYETIREQVLSERVRGTPSAVQRILKSLFENFLRYVDRKGTDKFGVVYTPQEVVSFIIRSVDALLRREFGKSLADPGVKILDPFTGTGTFIVDLLREIGSQTKDKDAIRKKYKEDIFANEIMLLSYYIALINIEATFSDVGDDYELFDHLLLTDTFRLTENLGGQMTLEGTEEEEFLEMRKAAKDEEDSGFIAIIGNPPYSVGQEKGNDGNANESYVRLDQRIKDTYVRRSNSALRNSLYDSYVRAFRWASDRLGEQGIIGFVTNGGYIDNLAFSGFRKCLLDEFTSIYVLNLRGDQRTKGEVSRKEGGKIFGSGSRTPVAITILCRVKGKPNDGYVHYCDIGDYLSREEKLQRVEESGSLDGIPWLEVVPNEKGDWINKTDSSFERHILLGDKRGGNLSVFSNFYSAGVKTGKDVWAYNFSSLECSAVFSRFKNHYDELLEQLSFVRIADRKEVANRLTGEVGRSYPWEREVRAKLVRGNRLEGRISLSTYRPFVKKFLANSKEYMQFFALWEKLKPSDTLPNIVISIPGIGEKNGFSALVSDQVTDLCFTSAHCQCFPLYWYEKAEPEDGQGLFFVTDDEVVDGYRRRYAIGADALRSFRQKYGDTSIAELDIFHYIYAVFHSGDYRERYRNNLAKEMPRIPLLKDFWAWANVGKELMDLHLHYENAAPWPGVRVAGDHGQDIHVTKPGFVSKGRRDVFCINGQVRIEGIPPEANEYKVNGRSPLEWIQDQYVYEVDKDSGIVDDPNQYDPAKGGRYVLDLAMSLVTVSMKTIELVKSLPAYEEID